MSDSGNVRPEEVPNIQCLHCGQPLNDGSHRAIVSRDHLHSKGLSRYYLHEDCYRERYAKKPLQVGEQLPAPNMGFSLLEWFLEFYPDQLGSPRATLSRAQVEGLFQIIDLQRAVIEGFQNHN